MAPQVLPHEDHLPDTKVFHVLLQLDNAGKVNAFRDEPQATHGPQQVVIYAPGVVSGSGHEFRHGTKTRAVHEVHLGSERPALKPRAGVLGDAGALNGAGIKGVVHGENGDGSHGSGRERRAR